jgi:hypothetical protein
MNIVNRILKMEEINGGARCPTYMYRWTFLSLPWFKVYLHHFVGDDWSNDLHDHPKRFVSIGLWGGYFEESVDPDDDQLIVQSHYRAPWIRTFPATHIHRISLGRHRDAWTLVCVFKTVREWGFWHLGRWMHWRTYVGSKAADEAKNCP